jgi:hypothetical protein
LIQKCLGGFELLGATNTQEIIYKISQNFGVGLHSLGVLHRKKRWMGELEEKGVNVHARTMRGTLEVGTGKNKVRAGECVAVGLRLT